MKKNLPLVVIFGRTNVGKSTLFNCLTEKRRALMSPIPGTTRDSNLGIVSWQGSDFEVVDTGGIMVFDEKMFTNKKSTANLTGQEGINAKVQKQAIDFLKKADLILFVVDNKIGLIREDKELALAFKKNSIDPKKIILVANKVDSQTQGFQSAEFNKLSLGEPAMVSAVTGAGTGDLLDLVVKKIKKRKAKKTADKSESIFVCLLGKPNVGKSSLLNKLLGWEKVIVSEVPHTTREPQDTEILYKENSITLIDTAGISRHGKKGKDLSKFGIEKSLKTLSKADIALLIIDINENITHQDAKLVEEIIERGKSFVFIANKWDLINEKDTKRYNEYIRAKLPFAAWAPIIFVSALTGAKTEKIFDLILEIKEARQTKLGNSQLNKFLVKLVKIQPPAKGRGQKKPRIYELKQIGFNPPKFVMRIGPKEDLHSSYIRFVMNRLREKYKITGTPIKITVTKGREEKK